MSNIRGYRLHFSEKLFNIKIVLKFIEINLEKMYIFCMCMRNINWKYYIWIKYVSNLIRRNPSSFIR